MEKGLYIFAKINLLLLFLNPSISLGQKIYYSVEDLKNLEETHIIRDNKIDKILSQLLKKREQISDSSDNVIVLFIQKEKEVFKVSTTITNFTLLKENFPKKLGRIKGYFEYQKFLVLMFGKINQHHFQFNSRKKSNILRAEKRPKNMPPPIYEPIFLNFSLNEKEVKLINRSW